MQLDSLRFPWKLVICQLQYSLHFHHFVPNSIMAKCLSTKVWAQAYLRPNAQKVAQGVFFVSAAKATLALHSWLQARLGVPLEQDWVQTSRPAWVWASPGQSWAPRQNVDSLWLRQNSKKSILWCWLIDLIGFEQISQSTIAVPWLLRSQVSYTGFLPQCDCQF